MVRKAIDCSVTFEIRGNWLGSLTLMYEFQAIYDSKENIMKTIIAVLASILLFGSAFAQTPAASAAPASANAAPAAMTKADANRDMRVEKHITGLRAKLKITPAEETQWAVVAKTMRDSASEIDRAIDKRKATMKNATAIDDLNAYGEIAQAHANSVKNLSAAFSPLYASMTDDQKKLADQVFARRAHDGKKMHKAIK